jgi:uncharacterized Zn-finger protein
MSAPVTKEIIVKQKKVSCNGKQTPTDKSRLGHPKVFLNFGKLTKVICPYCSQIFTLAPSQ